MGRRAAQTKKIKNKKRGLVIPCEAAGRDEPNWHVYPLTGRPDSDFPPKITKNNGSCLAFFLYSSSFAWLIISKNIDPQKTACLARCLQPPAKTISFSILLKRTLFFLLLLPHVWKETKARPAVAQSQRAEPTLPGWGSFATNHGKVWHHKGQVVAKKTHSQVLIWSTEIPKCLFPSNHAADTTN